ncbi:hypothetical protein Tco_1480146, partial [Tanacetum coccineum]
MNKEEAIRLVNNLSNHGYRLDSLNLSSINHALCDSNRFGEDHNCFQSRLVGSSAIGIVVPDERTFQKDIVDLCLDQSASLLITALVFRVSQSFNAVVKLHDDLRVNTAKVRVTTAKHNLVLLVILVKNMLSISVARIKVNAAGYSCSKITTAKRISTVRRLKMKIAYQDYVQD